MNWISIGWRRAGIGVACVMGLTLATCSSDKTITPTPPPVGPDGRLYVLNQSDSTLYVYDTKDLTRVDSMHTQVPNPHYIDFSPDGLNYYITTLEATGHLAKFSKASGFVDSVTTQPSVQPSAIAITADNQFGYVCNFSSPGARTEIHKYDLTTMQWLKQLQAGAFTHDIKITSDGSVVIACNRNTDDLTFIYPDADTLTFVDVSATGPSLPGQQIYGPFGVAIDHIDSLVFVACMDALQVRWLDIATRTVVDSIDIPVDTVGTFIAGPTLMAISPDNDVVFVTTREGNSVVVFRVSTKQVLADIPLATPNPFGITMSQDGSRVYVACVNTTFAQGMVYAISGTTYAKTDSIVVGKNSFGLIWHPAP